MSLTTPSEIGSRLERIRRIEGLSQAEFCDVLDISRTSLQNYVRGDREIPLSILATLLERFAVDPVWMMYGDVPEFGMRQKSSILAEIRTIGMALERRADERDITLTAEERWKLVSQVYTAFSLQNDPGRSVSQTSFIIDQMIESNGYS